MKWLLSLQERKTVKQYYAQNVVYRIIRNGFLPHLNGLDTLCVTTEDFFVDVVKILKAIVKQGDMMSEYCRSLWDILLEENRETFRGINNLSLLEELTALETYMTMVLLANQRYCYGLAKEVLSRFSVAYSNYLQLTNIDIDTVDRRDLEDFVENVLLSKNNFLDEIDELLNGMEGSRIDITKIISIQSNSEENEHKDALYKATPQNIELSSEKISNIPVIIASPYRDDSELYDTFVDTFKTKVLPKLISKGDKWKWGHAKVVLETLGIIANNTSNTMFGNGMGKIFGIEGENIRKNTGNAANRFPSGNYDSWDDNNLDRAICKQIADVLELVIALREKKR